jgi:hypothetical protein
MSERLYVLQWQWYQWHLNTGPLEFRTQTGHSKFVCKKFHLNIRLHFVRFLNWSGDSNVRYSIVWYLDIHCTVNIKIPTFWIPAAFEIPTKWSPVFKCQLPFKYWMICQNSSKPLDTGLETGKQMVETRCCLNGSMQFDYWSNIWAMCQSPVWSYVRKALCSMIAVRDFKWCLKSVLTISILSQPR